MQERPTTFGELLSRCLPDQANRKQSQLSVVASAIPLVGEWRAKPTGGNSLSSRPLSVVLHSVTAAGMRLTHAQPMRAKQVAVRISLITGEMLQVLLSLGRTRKTGDLYETRAEFIRSETQIFSSSRRMPPP